MKFPREFYIPKDATERRDDETGAVVYTYEKVGRLYGLAFGGKRSKPDWHFQFVNEKQREDRIAGHFASEQRKKEYKEARKAKNKKPHGLKVGDIFYSSWGYDQTNVDFYEVTRVVSDRTVEIREISSGLVNGEEGFMTGYVVAAPGQFIGDPIQKRVDTSYDKPSIKINSFATGFLWDGEKKRVSWYA